MEDFKYKDATEFIIQNLDGINYKWKFSDDGSCDCKGHLKVGEKAKVRADKKIKCNKYELVFEDGLISDFLSEKDLDVMIGDQFKSNNMEESNKPLLETIKELKQQIVNLNRENIVIADRVHDEALKDLREIKSQYECQISELVTRIKELENFISNCSIDPSEGMKQENVRLRQVIKLLSEGL